MTLASLRFAGWNLRFPPRAPFRPTPPPSVPNVWITDSIGPA
jgi:hypothetical protein